MEAPVKRKYRARAKSEPTVIGQIKYCAPSPGANTSITRKSARQARGSGDFPSPHAAMSAAHGSFSVRG